MKVKRFHTGPFQTNSFLVWNENKEAYFFDCEGESLNKVFDFIEEEGLNLKYIVLTHGHGDHIAGLNKIVEEYPEAEVYIGKEEAAFLTEGELNLMVYITGRNFVYNGTYNVVKDGDKIGEFVVIDTPGHTIGSKSFYCPESKILISGDTMFRRSYGRYDLPTSSGDMLFKSLRKLCELPEDVRVYSGHSDETTIGEEKQFLSMQGLI